MASNIMNYIPEVMHNVSSVLARIEDNEGKITSKLIKGEIERMKGQWASEVINVALMALGRESAVSGMVSTSAQVDALVEMAKKRNEYVIDKIKALRETREKAKEGAAKSQPEVTITVVDVHDEDEPQLSPEEASLKRKQPYMLTVMEAATTLGMSQQRVRTLLAEGKEFPRAEKHGSIWLIPYNEVNRYLYAEHKPGRPSKAAQ